MGTGDAEMVGVVLTESADADAGTVDVACGAGGSGARALGVGAGGVALLENGVGGRVAEEGRGEVRGWKVKGAAVGLRELPRTGDLSKGCLSDGAATILSRARDC